MQPTEECIAAAKLANADDFIKHFLEHGYQTQLTAGGQSLSQRRQRQLLSIARAAVSTILLY